MGLAKSLNFVENGQHSLGTEQDARLRLAWEHILNFHNALYLCGLELAIPFQTLNSSTTYLDSETQTSKAITPYPVDPSNSNQMQKVLLYRRYYKFLLTLCHHYCLHLTKSHHRQQMKSLSDEVESSMAKFGLSEYLPIRSALIENGVGSDQDECMDNRMMDMDIDERDTEPITISRVLDRKVCCEQGKVCAQLRLRYQ